MAILYLLRVLDKNQQYTKIGILSEKYIKTIHDLEENEIIPSNHIIPQIQNSLLIYKGIFPFHDEDYHFICKQKNDLIQIYQNGNIYVDFINLRQQIFLNNEPSVIASSYPHIILF